ncbi:hypothetical protein SHIRM173S_03131 [Streptomyces hirsutus]
MSSPGTAGRRCPDGHRVSGQGCSRWHPPRTGRAPSAHRHRRSSRWCRPRRSRTEVSGRLSWRIPFLPGSGPTGARWPKFRGAGGATRSFASVASRLIRRAGLVAVCGTPASTVSKAYARQPSGTRPEPTPPTGWHVPATRPHSVSATHGTDLAWYESDSGPDGEWSTRHPGNGGRRRGADPYGLPAHPRSDRRHRGRGSNAGGQAVRTAQEDTPTSCCWTSGCLTWTASPSWPTSFGCRPHRWWPCSRRSTWTSTSPRHSGRAPPASCSRTPTRINCPTWCGPWPAAAPFCRPRSPGPSWTVI